MQRKAHVPGPVSLSLVERTKKHRFGKEQRLYDDSLRHWGSYLDKVVDKYSK